MKFAPGPHAAIDAAVLCPAGSFDYTAGWDRMGCVTRGVGLHDGLYRVEQQVFHFTTDACRLFIVSKIEIIRTMRHRLENPNWEFRLGGVNIYRMWDIFSTGTIWKINIYL